MKMRKTKMKHLRISKKKEVFGEQKSLRKMSKKSAIDQRWDVLLGYK